MRSKRRYFNADGSTNLQSSFLSCEKDTETIIKKLFIDSYPYSDTLKRLLIINNPDCLDDLTNPAYKEKIDSVSIADLVKNQYIRLKPQLMFGENEEVKSYIVITFDNFVETSNHNYRDCIIMIDVLCNIDSWDLGNYRLRPLKIVGYIDGILNSAKLSGIGRLEFLGCNQLIFSEDISGYCLMYRAVHGEDDMIESEDEE